MRALIIDTETTSLIDNHLLPFDKQPEVVEFFGVLIDLATGEVQQEYETLIKPSRPLTEETIRITHITPELLADAPPFDAVLPDLNTFLASADILIGHNLSFDMEILDLEFERRGQTIAWPARKICTVEQTVHLRGFRLNLTALHETLFNEPFPEAHRARHDVQATARCACELFKRGELVLGYGGVIAADVEAEPAVDAIPDVVTPDVVITDAVTILHGDCLAVMKTLVPDSVDAIVTDPPYHLTTPGGRGEGKTGFMGSAWDGGDVAFNPATWAEALRVLKPGGYLLAFGGPRNAHRMVCAIEDAGYEIRDCIYWAYGSGFPKSHDVSKGIDKAAGAERKVVGPSARHAGRTKDTGAVADLVRYGVAGDFITAPATDAARQWAGFGTALKPAIEPIVWAQKKFTVVPDCATIIEFSAIIEALLWSMSSAKLVELFSWSKRPEQGEASDSVRLIAALLDTLSSHGASVVTDTFNSPEEGSTFLSTALLWNAISAASWPQLNTSTTSTATGLTTGLRTLSCLASGIMPENIIRAAIAESGVWSHAKDAGSQSTGSMSFSTTIPAPSATEHVTNATMKAIRDTLARLAVESSLLPLATVESFVRQPAPTGSQASDCANSKRAPALIVASLLKLSQREIQSIVAECAWQQPIENTLSPNVQQVCLARKPLSEKTVAGNVLKHRTGALNIDKCRVELNGDYKSKANGRPSQTGLGDNYDPAKANIADTIGRWPSHLIHDGSAEITAAFPNAGGQQAAVSGKEPSSKTNNVYGQFGGRPTSQPRGDSGSASRFFKVCPPDASRIAYYPKASRRDREAGMEGNRNVHATVKPTSLMRYLCRLICPPSGTILDPFAGSGSTGRGAVLEGFNFIGIEQDAEFVEIARLRIADAQREDDDARPATLAE